MSFLGMWCLAPMDPDAIARYAPELAPAIAAEASRPASMDLLEWWRSTGSVPEAMDRFIDLAGPSVLDERICTVYEAWERGYDKSLPHLGVATCKAYPAAGMAFALGPQRYTELPGWFGDLILTPEQVAQTLPAVERAYDWTPQSRRQAELRLTAALHGEGDRDDITALLDGVSPVWRAAADAGRGLLGAHFIP
ncbi:hypothetical protein GCM10018790_81200 [Kitasatospora xanthocidica]|uniref:hypothetical protein n=1 Tax=Kitasatospora xanthocidica TaxID=83382 RepID=UPI0016770DD3|nr:hypothetical protein [Kitasatospora xanthocidica]GHF91833.1 hypothetical protein GCM10018790_81200 [Kitasatospora xanthocidica]